MTLPRSSIPAIWCQLRRQDELTPRSSILLVPMCACGLALSAPAAAEPCGVSGATTASIGTYNPFSSTGFTEVSIKLTLNRLTPPDGGETRRVNFFLVEPSGHTAPAIGRESCKEREGP